MRNDIELSGKAEGISSGSISGIDAARVQQQLQRILSSELFTKSPQLSRFLRFCVDRVLLGRQDELKEQVLGVEVFRRSSSFDPRVDPIVRVEARRLRAKLEDYYSGEGRFDPLIVYFQRGDYVPRVAAVPAGGDKSAAPALSARVLVVEDERLVARDLENRLKALGYTVVKTAATGEGAIQAAEEARPDIVLMDIALSGPMRGTDAARRIWQRWHIPVVYLTAFSDAVVLEDMRGTEPYGYVLKPFEPRQLHGVLQLALSRRGREIGEMAASREQMRIDALLSAMETACVEAWEWTVKDPEAPWPSAVEDSRSRLLPESDDDPLEFLKRIVPADRARVREALQSALRESTRVEVGYRRRAPDNLAGFAIAVGAATRDETGKAKLSGLEISVAPQILRQTPAAVELQDLANPAGTRASAGTELTPISADAALDKALDSIRDELRDTGAQVSRSTPLPTVASDEAALAGVFENLLVHAAGKRAGGRPVRVLVSAERVDPDWVVTIRAHGGVLNPADLAAATSTIRSLGGVLEIEMNAGGDSIARLILPAIE
jgi:AmiR/NasT family two-component response regulator